MSFGDLTLLVVGGLAGYYITRHYLATGKPF